MMKWNIASEDSGDIIETLLKNRGIEPKDRDIFLNPNWDRDTHDPMQFTQMTEAVERVFLALEKGESIVIHGDYDADGVCGSTVLYTALRDICEKLHFKFNVEAFLPDRERDGYGVAMHTIERFAQENKKLIITVDCGIANYESLDKAHDLGLDVVICDHHQLAEKLPEHAIIIHPLAPGEDYPNKTLCGTGVAFKLASALIAEAIKKGAQFPEGYEKWLLDLVAIATVTDVMPLNGENRVLEKYGLMVLNKTRRKGIRKIIDFSRGELGSIDTQVIGFQIGPRLNAAGRIRTPQIAFETLASQKDAEAEKLAGELEMLNRERQKISRAAYESAEKIAQTQEDDMVQVIWNEQWMHGVVGLIAGKIVQKFGVPSFVFTKVGDHYVGSGRSIGGMHLVEGMKSCGDIFLKAGGHPQACGLTIDSLENLELFKSRIIDYAKTYFNGKKYENELSIDCELPLERIDWQLYEEVHKLEPFGQGNPRPVFVAHDLRVLSCDAIGKTGSHLRLNVQASDGSAWKMIGFGFGDWAEQLSPQDVIDVAYELGVNEWNGKRELQCKIEDLRFSKASK
jgi:single-stranded-DNA-specific exonuclease